MSSTDHDDDDDRSFADQPGAWSDWQAVSLGERSVAEVEAARRARGEAPERVAEAAKLFAPYDEREREDLVDGVLAALTPRVRAVEPTPIPTRSGSPRATAALVVLLATAAALALWIVWPADPQPIGATSPVPVVALEVKGATADTWAAEPRQVEVYRFVPDASFVWTLRPATGEHFEAEVRAFVIDEGHEREIDLRAVEVVHSARTGAVELQGRVADLALEQGRATIVLVYGRPGDVTADPRVAASLQDGVHVQVERMRIVVEPRP